MKLISLKKKPLVCLTAYNKRTAELIDGICDMILVGDSLAMAYYGDFSTRKIDLKTIIRHALSVRKGIKKSIMIVDMPFGSYKNPKQALKNAKEILKKTGCDGVKLEGGMNIKNIVKKLIKNKIQVVGHIGLLPQSVKSISGFRVKGKNIKEENKIINDFIILQKLGVSSVVIEAVKEKIAKQIIKIAKIPIIGIGASKWCSGQILVTEDMLGFFDQSAKFVKKYANIKNIIQKAAMKYRKEVRSRKFPAIKNIYH